MTLNYLDKWMKDEYGADRVPDYGNFVIYETRHARFVVEPHEGSATVYTFHSTIREPKEKQNAT